MNVHLRLLSGNQEDGTGAEEIVYTQGDQRIAGFNKLLKEAYIEGDNKTHYVLYDDTVEIDLASMRAMQTLSEELNCHAVGPMVLLNDRNSIEHGGGIEPFSQPVSNTGTLSNGHHTKSGYDLFVSNACLLIPRWCVLKYGLLDDNYQSYYAFADYCFRIRSARGRVGYCAEAKAYWEGDPVSRAYRERQAITTKPFFADAQHFWNRWASHRPLYTKLLSEVLWQPTPPERNIIST